MRMSYSIFNLIFVFKIVASAGSNSNEGFRGTNSDLIRMRGFLASDHYVTTTDGYILNVVEMRNPSIPDGYSDLKSPVLFIPGIRSNAAFFILNSVRVKPKDYRNLDVNSMDEKELLEMLKSDPAANSLPFLASNFGHRIFLLNRRGSQFSRGFVGENNQAYSNPLLTGFETLFGGFLPLDWIFGDSTNSSSKDLNPPRGLLRNNPRYWNFSLDEQAKYDIPEVIKYILEETKKEKLAIVGHSAGAALVLMALTEKPDLADSISKALLWGPALYPTSFRDLISAYLGVVPLFFYLGPVQGSGGGICSNVITQSTSCRAYIDTGYGVAASQSNLTLNFFEISSDTEGSRSYLSLAQAAIKGKMHHFDYVIQQRNQIAYGRDSPPIYDVSKIKLKTISLWSGVTDGLVPYRTALEIGNDMSVPVEQVYLNEPGLLFNHISYSIHYDLPRLVNIPALKRIES